MASLTIIIASIAACAENAHYTWPPSTHCTAGSQHVGLNMYIACFKGLSEK